MKNILNLIRNQSRGTVKVPWRTLLMSVCVLVLYALGPGMFDLCVFDKTKILHGEFWRIITGHFVHSNLDHLFWDVLALVLLGSIIEIKSPKALIFSFVIGCLFVSLWMFLGVPNMTVYYGLSGALNGWLVIACLTRFREASDRKYLFVLGIAAIKMVYEMLTHNTVFVSQALVTIPSSHLAGFAGGIFCWLLNMEKANLSPKRHSGRGPD